MKLGFFSAPLPGKTLAELIEWGSTNGFHAIEVACWPDAFESRRYAGTKHIDVLNLTERDISDIQEKLAIHDMTISALGYYPNPLDPDPEVREACHNHLKKCIVAAERLGVGVLGTFIGRDRTKNVADSLAEYKQHFEPLVRFAEDHGIRIAIENCPMLWEDRWPGGDNLATTPVIWEQMFDLIPSPNLGLNLDPSHLIWQGIDYIQCVHEFSDRIFHTHAKDTKLLPEHVKRNGIYGFGNYIDKLAGMGDIDWDSYFAALRQVGYTGAISVEHEDRDWEKGEESILKGILLAGTLMRRHLENGA